MQLPKRVKINSEALVLSLLISGISLHQQVPLFYQSWFFLPYLLIGTALGVSYGLQLALGSLVFLYLPLGAPLLNQWLIIPGITLPGSLSSFYISLLPVLSVNVLLLYVVGGQRNRIQAEMARYRSRLASISYRDLLQKRTIKSLEIVNRELEERVSKNYEAISSIYKQIQELYSRSSEVVLQGLLNVVTEIAQVKQATIYRFDVGSHMLVPVKTFPEGDIQKGLAANEDLNQSIPGWVFRNNSFFSLRMMYSNPLLAQIVNRESILAYPIEVGNKVWGVLAIEKMEFFKYNLYTEQTISIIISLAKPALESALDYESKILMDELDPVTNLPHFSQLYRYLGDELSHYTKNTNPYSLILLEITNYHKLSEVVEKKEIKQFLNIMIFQLEDLIDFKAQFFHYKEENQLAILLPGKDQDVVSKYCLDFLERISLFPWTIGTQKIDLEVILGYSSVGPGIKDEDTLMARAEHLLAVQRL